MLTATIVLISTGCVTDMVKGLNKSLKGLSLNTDKKSAIIFAGTTVNSVKRKGRGSYLISGEGRIFLLNVNTKKEITLPLKYQADGLPIYTNLDSGTYRFSKWAYNACKEVARDKYGNTYCSSWHYTKGMSDSLKGNTFEVKEGETLYLGHFILESKNTTISLLNKEELDTQKFKDTVEIKNRKIQNISNKFNIKDWKFNITGKAGVFGL